MVLHDAVDLCTREKPQHLSSPDYGTHEWLRPSAFCSVSSPFVALKRLLQNSPVLSRLSTNKERNRHCSPMRDGEFGHHQHITVLLLYITAALNKASCHSDLTARLLKERNDLMLFRPSNYNKRIAEKALPTLSNRRAPYKYKQSLPLFTLNVVSLSHSSPQWSSDCLCMCPDSARRWPRFAYLHG